MKSPLASTKATATITNALLILKQTIKPLQQISINEQAFYVSAVIIPAKVVYNVDWGCPDDGEDVYIIKGVNNTQFVKPADYKEAVTMLIEKLATVFEQSTVTTTWSTVKFVYTTKKGED